MTTKYDRTFTHKFITLHRCLGMIQYESKSNTPWQVLTGDLGVVEAVPDDVGPGGRSQSRVGEGLDGKRNPVA